MRWQTADGEFVPPSEFIPLAERAGLITSITEWAIDQAARQSAAWRSRGTLLPIAVNASARDLADPRLPQTLATALQRWAIPGEAIDIEITETDLMTDLDDAERNCAAIREMGVGISIDDFGTGYSPLVYLHRLPVTSLKIDRSFIQGIMHGDEVRSIIHSVTELAHRLRITVTAEGIEQEAELDILRSLGCDVGQGYYFSRALPPGELETWSTRMDGRETPREEA
jgi:EAL domain-containing protein (putative c-di-GMP-specific phosphodiesterase class I)